jgi:hypothetical protein
MKSSIKHNKLKNTGILFELLVRQITSDLMENKQNSPAVQLMREFFNSKKELGKELILYRAFFNAHNLSEQRAFELVRLVTEQRKTLDQTVLNHQKYLLIKEIKNNFELKDFFASRVPAYKIYASISKVFESATTGTDIASIDELANSQFTIVEHLSGKTVTKESTHNTELSQLIRSQEDDIRYLSYKILIENFNEKYKNLDGAQKKLLQEYIHNISNTSNLKKYVQTESTRLSVELKKLSKKITDDVTRIKLHEVISQLNRIQTVKTVKENHMTALLIAMEISKSIKTLGV